MRIEKKLLLGFCAIGLLTGCETTGLSRHERAGVTYPNYILALKPTVTANGVRPVETPLRLAVAQVGESAPPRPLMDALQSSSLVRNVVGLPAPGEGSVRKEDANANYVDRVESLCNLARNAGADYLFLCGGDVSLWNDPNALTVLDLTIVGAWVIPSTRICGEGKAAGAIVDVRTKVPVLFINVESSNSRMATSQSAYSKREGLSVELRAELSQAIARELLARLAERSNISATHQP
jgi:hypothetical protein